MEDLNYLQVAVNGLSSNKEMIKLEEGEIPPVIIIEDDPVFGSILQRFLSKKLSSEVVLFASPNSCIEYLDENEISAYCLVTDITFDNSSIDGLTLIDLLRSKNHRFEIVVMTGFASIESAITATKKGVFQYLTKPFELEVMFELVASIFEIRFGIKRSDIKEQVPTYSKVLKKGSLLDGPIVLTPPTATDIFCGMIGRSAKMKELFSNIKKIASSESTALITGPSGTGKELVASAIHLLSKRNKNKIVSVNCGAIPGELLESELFGHVKGAFTGAVSNRKGRFEVADGGTIFLDEIGDMPFLLQVKLLRALQTRKVEPVGGEGSIDVDIRIIAATHTDLEMAVRSGDFREDLFYRLNVIPIKLPPLSERREDIPLLISYFLSRLVSADGRNSLKFEDETLEILVGYDWPGNIRELENLLERLVILRGGGLVRPQDLPAKFFTARAGTYQFDKWLNIPDDGIDFREMISEIENHLILQALNRTNGNKNRASKLLQMNRTTLIEKMRKKGLLSPSTDLYN